jgi:hypothetical protein
MSQTSPPAADRRPDAVMFRQGFEPGADPAAPWAAGDREHRVFRYCNHALGCLAHVNHADFGDGWKFAAPKHASVDTFLFPKGHPLEGRPRYDWVDQPNGVRFGYKKPEA